MPASQQGKRPVPNGGMHAWGAGPVGVVVVVWEVAAYLCSGVDLVASVGADGLGQLAQVLGQQRGVLHHHLLDLDAVLAGLALDRVGGQREGSAHEAQQRRTALRLPMAGQPGRRSSTPRK